MERMDVLQLDSSYLPKLWTVGLCGECGKIMDYGLSYETGVAKITNNCTDCKSSDIIDICKEKNQEDTIRFSKKIEKYYYVTE